MAHQSSSVGVPLREDLRREERHVPAVGVARDDAQQALLALAADPEPEPRLHRSRIAERVGQVDVLAVEGDALAVEEAAEHDRGLLELVEAVLDRQERHAEGAELALVPAGAEPELDAAAAQVVDGDRGLAEHARIPIADAEDQAADRAPRVVVAGERRHRRDAFERRARRIA